MTERFYDMSHLSTAYIKKGWKDFDYFKLQPDGVKPPELSDTEIIYNLDAGLGHNYCVYMIDCEGEQDGIMFSFGLAYHPEFAVNLYLPLELLDELVAKYGLVAKEEAKDYTINEFLIEEHMRGPQS